MPHVLHPRVRKSVARLAALTTVGFFASTGLAAACATQATTQPFTQFGDTNGYFLVQGGSFESNNLGDPASFATANATLTAENEPFYLNSSSDSQSLAINAGGSATSPGFCVDGTMPYFRFIAKQTAPGGDLLVSVVGKDPLAGVQVADLADGSLSSWGPTAQLNLASALNKLGKHGTAAQLRFQVLGGGSWQIDDVYIDPYRTA
jgi:hypothetical protein